MGIIFIVYLRKQKYCDNSELVLHGYFIKELRNFVNYVIKDVNIVHRGVR